MTRRVLVTGVTGFVGREVARELLRTGRSITVLARARDGVPAAARVAAAVGATTDDERVKMIEGDLAVADCGLHARDWRSLQTSVDTVIHCAGDTTFAPERLEPFEAGHVGGPRRLLEGLAGGRLRRWVHVSTAYVCGQRQGLIRESEGDLGQAFHNVYERVKLASETALRAAGARAGVAVRIARPGIVVGPAPLTGGGAPSNLLFDFVRLTATFATLAAGRPLTLRIEAAARARFNFVPLDYVAAALVHLAEPEPSWGSDTVHLVAHDPPTQAEVLETITERLGVRGLTLVDALDDPSPLERRVARMLRSYRPYLGRHVTFDDTHARHTLPPALWRRATLSRTSLHALIDLALTTEARWSPRAATRWRTESARSLP
ncbi:MAG TPA: SDR family oxidoreductase [Candidatus Acidoferrum sp.]|nr:SDR family oxidoreductase [Candidatus Acidoferrum sp.]